MSRDYQTAITLYQNTTYKEANKYINFGSVTARNDFFDPEGTLNPFPVKNISQSFNMVRDRLTIRVPFSFKDLNGFNYARFFDWSVGIMYYCFILQIRYVNDAVSEIEFLPDVLMTFCQGNFIKATNYVNITRQHLSNSAYESNIYKLMSNDDVLQSSEPQNIARYIQQFATQDTDMYVSFQCTCELNPANLSTSSSTQGPTKANPWGTVDAPLNPSPTGATVDTVTSPVGLFISDYKDFQLFMKDMSPYPWITQQISAIQLIPKAFIGGDPIQVPQMTMIDYSHLANILPNWAQYNIYTWKNPTQISAPIDFSNISLSWNDILQDGNLDAQHLHLLREPYTAIKGYDYATNQLDIDISKLPIDFNNLSDKTNNGLSWDSETILGYINQVSVYPNKYNSNGDSSSALQYAGDYLGRSMTFNSFDQIPVLINNYQLGWANNAYQRNQNFENTNFGAIQTAEGKNPNATNYYDKVAAKFNSLSYAGNAAKNMIGSAESGYRAGGGGVMGAIGAVAGAATTGGLTAADMMSSEADYYRALNATQKTMQLQPPTITAQSMGNAFNLNNGIYGITLKLMQVPSMDLLRAKLYHCTMGFKWDLYDKLQPYNSMSLMNYFQFTGTWFIDNVPVEMMSIIQGLFESGVQCWHVYDKYGQFNDIDLSENTRVL